MHYLDGVIEDIDKTHPRLGKAVATAMVAVKAKRMMLIVSPRGCGKSRITELIGNSYPQTLFPDALSVAGLAPLANALSNFDGLLVIDDLSRAGTEYAMLSTTASLAELCYGHRLQRYMLGSTFEITEFNGSVLANIQPVLLKMIVKHPLWESSMMDKSMRYYHMFRPLEPNPSPPNVTLEWGSSIGDVSPIEFKGKRLSRLWDLGEVQWGTARVREHTEIMLKACASLDNRKEVTQADVKLLHKLILPMAIEGLAMDKTDFEAKRFMNSNQLALLTEFATYGQFTIKQLVRDYKLSISQCYRIMAGYTKFWQVVSKSPTTYAPSDELAEELRKVGIKC